MTEPLHTLLLEVLSITIDAGREIMRVYQKATPLETSYKEDGSPLTEADRFA